MYPLKRLRNLYQKNAKNNMKIEGPLPDFLTNPKYPPQKNLKMTVHLSDSQFLVFPFMPIFYPFRKIFQSRLKSIKILLRLAQ
jgi:hypothetical protein